MSAQPVIRKATADDLARVEAAAERFARRYDIPGPTNLAETYPWTNAVDAYVGVQAYFDNDRDAARVWRGYLRRAVREPGAFDVAYGFIVGKAHA